MCASVFIHTHSSIEGFWHAIFKIDPRAFNGYTTLSAIGPGKRTAIADLIASTSAASHKLALQQMRGGFSKELEGLRGNLLHFVTMIELEIDFSEVQVEFADRKDLRELADALEKHLSRLMDSFKLGNAIKNGILVAIVGVCPVYHRAV
jgi:tRNA U34 5-carboxymethylaminomethyl modifying GTPase MnmE/TrmE